EHLPGLVGLFPKHAIARRIEMILNYKKSNLFYAALGVVLVTAVAAFGLTSAQSQKEENATQTQNDGKTLVYGRVVDESGKPAVGAIVRANIMTGNEFCITDADGNFVLPVKNPYRWTTFWAVSADGNQLGQGCPKILEGETTIRKVEVTLKKDVRIITGKVVDGEGKPVQDAWVGGTGQCAKPLLVQSDSEGQFRFPWPGDETLQRVYAFKDHLGFDFAGTDEPDSAEGIIIPEKIDNGPFMLVLQRPQTVKIRVVDENKKIIPGAIVSTWLIRKKDAREGRNHKEFNTAFGPWQTNTRTDTNGIAVFDWIPTENISQILFTAYGDHVKGNLREDGTVRFFGSDEVRYEPNAEKDKWWEYEECKNGQCHLVKEGETEKWIYETDRQGIVNLTLPRSARVLGTVKYSDGSPVPYTFVSRKSHNQCGHGLQFTNEKGEFELDENANFLLNLAAESTKECAPAIFAYNVGDGTEVQKLDIVLQKGVKLHGTVYDSEEKPVHGLFAVWIYEKNPDPACPDDVSIRQTSNYDTQDVPVYHYILPPGKFTVHANHQDQYSEEQDIEIKPGQTGEIQLDLHVKKKQEKGSDSEVSEAKNAGQTEKQTNTQTNIQMSDTDALLFGNGKWTNEKTGNVIPDGSIVQGTQGTFRLEQENGEGKVVRLSGAGASGHAEYVRFSDGGNKIVVSRVSFELQKKLDKEFAESGIRIGMDDVFVFENGEWKNEKTGNVIPA
ncbi:MAG: carboxypeptidase-like regulatory domain-containing protein, partial [Planctomycetaceae bacterium]|nr:carboxypeptidase-like regulatory domain-containing protein [Planctomycetaceae bacterium]